MNWPRRGPVTPPVLSPWFSYGADHTVVSTTANASKASSTLLGAANTAVCFYIWVPEVCRITTWWWQNGLTVAGNVDVGWYTKDGVRLVSMGSTPQAGPSVIQTSTVNLPATLPAGPLLLCLSTNNATATFWGTGDAGMREAIFVASAFPLPAAMAIPAVPGNSNLLTKFGVLVAPRVVV